MKIVLGSKSPRRKEILSLMGYTFDVRVSDANEIQIGVTPIEVVSSIANQKVNNIEISDDELLICADTIVALNNLILGKPKTKDEARKMIDMLQGKTHIVYTAVYIKTKSEHIEFVDEAQVTLKKMAYKEIEDYINTDEPYDKAGGYAIQGIFSKYIESFKGDYYTIMGLPKNRLEKELNKIIK